MILFDDIGSYPLPKDVTRPWVVEAVKRNDTKLQSILKDVMWQKIEAGLDVPTYPQFQDMNWQFLDIINDESRTEEPLLVKRDRARIVELEALEEVGAEYYKKNGKKLNVRVCVTGPVELYMKQFGGTAYSDVLSVLATSVDRFIENSIANAKQFKIATVSIDEPSIGINPNIMFDESDLIDAIDRAARTAALHNIDTEIHLHSPLYYKLVCDVPSISIVGVESAANPSYLDLIDKKDLDEYDKFLRVGIARTDIYNMAAALNEKYGVNVWKEKESIKLNEIITEIETPQVIEKRLGRAYNIFGERIKYAGPDCGLGAFTQELAFKLLQNTGTGIKEFLKKIVD